MQSITAMRITIGSLAALLTASIAYGIHAGDQAQALRAPQGAVAERTPAAATTPAEPSDGEWSEEGWEGEEGWQTRDDDDGGLWRLVVPDTGGVQPVPSQAPESRAS